MLSLKIDGMWYRYASDDPLEERVIRDLKKENQLRNERLKIKSDFIKKYYICLI